MVGNELDAGCVLVSKFDSEEKKIGMKGRVAWLCHVCDLFELLRRFRPGKHYACMIKSRTRR